MKKLISIIATSAILLNSFYAPLTAIAQEITPTPAPTPEATSTSEPTQAPEETTAPTPKPTISPTEEPTMSLTPSETPIDLPTTTPEVSATPEETSTPTPTDQPIQTQAPESIPSTPGPPPEITGNETLNETLIENVDLSEVSEINSNVLDSGTITTDKPDYSPGSVAVISGNGFLPNKSYSIKITADKDYSFIDHNIQADSDGNIQYLYTLDTAFHPLYTVNIKGGEVVVATLSFTDTNWDCDIDAQGVNDEPGQKDLTKMCRDLDSTDPVLVTWNWDEKSPGGNLGGNTGDACSLFNTDGDLNANYSLCVIVDGNPSEYQNKILYSCSDTKADRCTNPTVISSGVTSTCGANVLSDDPFSPSGTDYPDDTVANCSINLSDMAGPSSPVLIDVCSYPSQQPNSDPSDCIIATTDNDTGTIEVIKDLYPSSDGGRFNLQIDLEDIALNVGDGETTGQIGYVTGTHTVGEVAYPGTNLSNYTSAISCNNSQGSTTGTGPLTITLDKDENIVCTITNTLKQGTIELKKVWVGTGGQTTLNIGTTAGGIEIDTQPTGQDGSAPLTTGQNSVNPGTYYLSERGGLNNYTTSPLSCFNDLNNDGDNDNEPAVTVGENNSVVITPDDHIICTYTNTRKQGTIIVKKVMVGGIDTFEFAGTPSGSISVDGGIIQATVNTGQYTSTETPLSGWKLTDLTCSDSIYQNSFGDKDTGVATFNVEYNETVTCTFTNTKYGSISGYKYEEGNQTPLAGWIISLYEGTDLVATQSTTLSGYSFTNLLPGIYSLFENLLSGWTPISSPSDVELDAGEISTKNNFVNFKNISITACKRVDADGNISTTGDQTNKQRWAVKLIKNGQVSDTQSTGEGGCYTWTDLGPGTYGVTEEALPSGWLPLTETTHNFGTAVSGHNQSFTFINFEKGHISGHKWNDLNGDGDWDKPDEPAIEGWTIYATYPNQSTHTRTTDSNGYYNFSGLEPGQYTIYEIPPTGWAQTYPASNYVIGMTSNGDFDSKDFGNQMRGTITIAKDAIPNSAQDFAFTSTQLGSFTLDGDSDPAKSNTKVFSDKGNGTYTITESEVSGWKLTDIVCEGDSDAQWDIDNRTATLEINEPGEKITCTFINTKYGIIQGKKYEDLNADGNWDNGEPFLNGWTINLFDDQMEPLKQMKTGDTGQTGQYKFTNLLPGTYYVCEEIMPGWKQTEPASGEEWNDSYCRTVEIAAGQTISYQHFGNFELTYIQGRKYNDLNGDGDQDQGEPNLNGWTVKLYDSDWNQIADNQLTHNIQGYGDGRFRFENLSYGTYYICEVLPDNWVQTEPKDPDGVENSSGQDDEAPRCRKAKISTSGTPITGKVFGNQGMGKVTIDKVTVPSGSEDEFTINLNRVEASESTTIHSFVLSDQEEPETFDAPVGPYWVEELENDEWELTDVSCTDGVGPAFDGQETGFQVMPGRHITCTFTNTLNIPSVTIEKTNDSGGGISAGSVVTYTLTLTNDGNMYLPSVDVIDVLPGGFTYVTGSTNGAVTFDPTISGGTLTWKGVGNLNVGESLTINYQAKTATDASNGVYTNYATCTAYYGRGEGEPAELPTINCNTASSTVSIGSVQGYGGNLVGQVLGISTELPATGNPTWVMAAAFIALGAGIFLNVYAKRKTKNVKK